MGRCDFFKETFQQVPISKELPGRNRKATGEKNRVICWCDHPKHSPCDEAAAGGGIGDGKRLQCDADRHKCPLSHTQYIDVFED